MVRALAASDVLALRMRAQRLAGERPTDAAEVVRAVCGVQAQSTRASRLAIRARSSGVDEAAVIRACDVDRSIVRTWAMRGTLHMLAREDVHWVVALLGPRFAAAGRRRRLELGLDDERCRCALVAIEEVLGRSGPLTRAELVRRIADRVVVDPTGQAPAHLVSYAAMTGLVCRGPEAAGDEPTYALLAEWVGDRRGPVGDAALAELARRYVAAYGPAARADFAAWSGLPLGESGRGLAAVAGELEEVEVAGVRMVIAGGLDLAVALAEPPVVRLVPDFDTCLLGYRGRDLALDARYAPRIQAGGGWIHAAVLVDGRVAGTWRQRRASGRLLVDVEPFEPLAAEAMELLESEVADLGRFLGIDAVLSRVA